MKDLKLAFSLAAWLLMLLSSEPAASERATVSYHVKVDDGFLFLVATQAPLVELLREIGRQAAIKIESNIGAEKKITTRLDRVLLEDGIRQLARNVSITYTQDANTNTRRIERVVVLSTQTDAPAPSKPSSEIDKPGGPVENPGKISKPEPRPEPFKFEFDPRAVPEKKPPAQKQP